MTLIETIAAVEGELDAFEQLHGDGEQVEGWDNWFEARSQYFRLAIRELFRTDRVEGACRGEVGDLSLIMSDVMVTHVDDGYRGLLMAWLDAARAAFAERQAVPA